MITVNAAASRAPGPDREALAGEVCLGQDNDEGCFELSSEACRVLAEMVVAAHRKAGKGNTEAA
jgi:hypothetical protein